MMASVDPYSPCPCGSGQKFKWCCQKVESFTERAQRLLDTGQYEMALKPLEEGLAKVPGNVLLLTRKALIHLHLNQVDAARQALSRLLEKHPGNVAGSIMMTRLVLSADGPAAGAAQYQQALSSCPEESRPQLAHLATFVGMTLAQSGFPAAGIKHAELASQLSGEANEKSNSTLRLIVSDPLVSIWEKNPYQLWAPPQNVTEQIREAFEQALEWSDLGLWSAAAAGFELLAGGSYAGAVAERNRGLCCLWLADNTAAIAALRRYIARNKPTADAIDLECLCQIIEPTTKENLVEFVQLSWPIRNKDALLLVLRGDKTIDEGPARHLVEDDPKSPEVARFFLLDRPKCTARPGLSRQDIPAIEAEILVGKDTVVLEAFDDGRLDRSIDRFTSRAGPNIPPAQPRTNVIDHESRQQVALSWRSHMPPGLSKPEAERLHREQVAFLISDVWPRTPHPALKKRTPLQTAKAGDSETALRAAVRILELSNSDLHDDNLWNQLREKLPLRAEPVVDLDRTDIDQIHLSRLSLIPLEQIDDDESLALYQRCRTWHVRGMMNRVARFLIAERPALLEKIDVSTTTIYGDLALEAAGNGDRPAAERWLERGRESDSPERRAANAVAWEMLSIHLQMIFDEPTAWVPNLAVLLERSRGSQEATSFIFLRLIELGLIKPVPDPYHPDQMAVDTRVLEHLLKEYGPRVTTATGELGVAARGSSIWTPGAQRAGGGGVKSSIWTPTSSPSPAAGEQRKVFIPGQ
jgi:tetratricopeptide (TPR) repeat protein